MGTRHQILRVRVKSNLIGAVVGVVGMGLWVGRENICKGSRVEEGGRGKLVGTLGLSNCTRVLLFFVVTN